MAKQGYSIKINKKTGQVSFDNVHGYGPLCSQATLKMEKMLGGAKEATRKYTEEFTEEQDNDLYQNT